MTSFHAWHRYLAILVLALVSSPAFAQVSISIDIAPPPLIIEDQPPMPDDGLIWTPGYWAYDDYQGEYYWVPGAWVQPPQVGVYWTPAYWGWNNNVYAFYPGYWGPTVGFYGGVNYGHGYWGHGYGGGRWDNNRFAYNRAANNVGNAHVYKTYEDRSNYRPENSNRVSYNGGRGGIAAQPTPQERQAVQANHVQPTPQQQTHFQQAAQQRTHQVKVNKNAATPGATPATAGAPAPGAQPNAQVAPQAAGQPAANKQDNALTGGDAQQKKEQHDQKVDKTPAAANAAPKEVHQDQVKAQNDAQHAVQQPAPVKPEASPANATKSEVQHAADQPAPEKHQAVAPAASAAKQEQHPAAAAPKVHPQAQAPANKPEGHPQAPAQPQQHAAQPAAAPSQAQPQPQGGQGGQGGDGGGQQHHQDGH